MEIAGTRVEERGRWEQLLGASSVLEAVAGAAAVVLPILGLLGFLPRIMAALTALVLGAAVFAEGSAMGARYSELLGRAGVRPAGDTSGGLGIEVLGGAAAITLGILALVGISPMAMLECCAIVLGGTLILGARAVARLHDLRADFTGTSDTGREVAREVAQAGTTVQTLAGAAAVVLGILALANAGAGDRSLTYVLAAFLSIGGALTVSGFAAAGRVLGLARPRRAETTP